MLGSKLRDHQCGFKAFKKESLLELLSTVQATHWFWDTEIMVRAHQQDYKIKEIPVEWHSGKDTKVNLAKDSWNMFWQELGLWWKLEIKERASKANPKIKTTPDQNTNHSPAIVMLTK